MGTLGFLLVGLDPNPLPRANFRKHGMKNMQNNLDNILALH
jgi:hypothetical protein